jgi:hypothetical protein
MIGFIKKLFSGILSFFVGLFAGKKSDPKLAASSAKGKKSKGYFMELNEDEQQPVNGTQPIKAEFNKAVDKTKELVAAATKSVGSEPAKAKAEPAKAKAEPAKASVATANNQPAKNEATANNPAAKVELVQTAEGVKAEPAKPTKASAASAKTQTETTFAPKYLAPSASTNGRRRPGPNMNTFLDMARQVKTPG